MIFIITGNFYRVKESRGKLKLNNIIMIRTKKQFYPLIITFILLCSCSIHLDENSITNIDNQKVTTKSIDEFVDLKMKEMNIHGLSLAIINNGQVAYHSVKGYADIEEEKLVTNETLFEGASMGKPVFAHLVMHLVEDRKIDLDKPLYEYLDYHYYPVDENDNKYKQITARTALSHTTGFPNWRSGNNLDIAFEPGTEFSYSGEGYVFLERVIQSILKTDYRAL